MNQKLTLADLPLKGKKILMRVDFNVPIDKDGKISDDTRIQASLPSIKYILDRGGSVILMSHLGRPKDKRIPELSLAPCAKQLAHLLQRSVFMESDCIGPEVEKKVQQLKPGEIILLENLRFHRAEEHPEEDPNFAKGLAKLADFYVNDAFGSSHRAHASITEITKYFPNKAAAGFLMEKEIRFLSKALLSPARPFYALIGGAKISTKLGVIKSLLRKADGIFIGGGMAYTFFKAQNIPIGNSISEDDQLEKAKEIINESRTSDTPLFLPEDHVIADQLSQNAKIQVVSSEKGIPNGFQGVDIGPKTIEQYTNRLQKASTIFWNGPLGIFEIPTFAKGTYAIASFLAHLSITTIVGGGDSISALQSSGLIDKISHVSTGGGATLEYIEFGTLPGIEALTERKAF